MVENAPAGGSRILRVGAPARIGAIDIREADDSVTGMVLREVFETPYSPPPTGSDVPQPLLFTEQLRVEPGDRERPVYSAAVRTGVVFADGTPLTAEIVRASLSKSDDIRAKADVEVKDDRVVFRLRSANARFGHVLTQNFCGVVLEKAGRLYGTGPFMFKEGATLAQLAGANSLVLVRNPRHRDAVKLDEIHFQAYAAGSGGSTEPLLEAVKRGEVDFTYSLTSVDAAKLMGFPVIPSISPGNATGILYLNTELPALASPLARRALALAIDRREIAKLTYEKNPLAFVAHGVLPPFMGTGGRDHLGFDLREAQLAAERAGAAMPKRLKLVVTWAPRPYMPNPREAAEALRGMLAQVGVTVELVTPRDRNDFFGRFRGGDYEMALAGWIADTADPADFLEAQLASSMVPRAGKVTATSNNISRLRLPAMDEALARFRSDPSAANRDAVLALVDEQAPLVPLIYGQAVAVYSNRVSGFRASPLGRTSLARLEIRSR